MKKYLTIVILGFFLSVWATARPAQFVKKTVTQPDGTSFTLVRYGDEFNKIRMTEDGCAVAQGEDKWWNYVVLDNEGKRYDSGVHVGTGVKADVISSSRMAAQHTKSARRESFDLLQNQTEPIISRIRASGMTKASGVAIQKHGIVLLAEYSDVKFKYRREDFQAMLTQKGYSVGGATGSAKEYFENQFGEGYEFNFDVSDIVTLKRTRAYYGGNDKNGDDSHPAEMIADACELAEKAGIDFSIYDQDSDGEVDNVFVIYAGEDEAEYYEGHDDCIWAHAWYIRDGAGINLNLNGKIINRYACCSELSVVNNKEVLTGIGTFCHEYSHTLGLADMYDTDYASSGGCAAALWINTALMDGGNANNNSNTPPYFNAIDREILGIVEPERITANGEYSLSPIGYGGKVYRLDTDQEDEYYLLECRSNTGWDKYIGGSGMLIYHIDKSKANPIFSETYNQITPEYRWNYYNEVNCNPSHQCADLIESGSLKDSFSSTDSYYSYLSSSFSASSLFFPRTGTTSISADTKPAMTWWSGAACPYTISNIRRDGSNILFHVSGFGDEPLPEVTGVEKYVFQGSAHIYFSSNLPQSVNKAIVTCAQAGSDEVEEYQLDRSESGFYWVSLDNLQPSTSYDVGITLVSEAGTTPEQKVSFMTSSYKDGSYPYINFKFAERNEDGSFAPGKAFPLAVANSIGADVRWSFEGEPIPVNEKGLFVPEKDGKLKAIVESPDGGVRIIVKQIRMGGTK